MFVLLNKPEEMVLGHIVNYAKGLYYRSDHLAELKIIIGHFLNRDPAKIEFGMILEHLIKTAQRVNPEILLGLTLEMTSPRRIKFHPGFASFPTEYRDECEERDEGSAIANLNAKIIVRFLLSEIAKFKGRLPAPKPDILPLNQN
ncbi:hypothetical protein A2303_04315 [Candidatus Falkowbacteria bacterium RIFOXYB2_FULL_47_14]|uniref:Uncharacterized protein n=1 Tax=Candidatus Falkowbacteria bacterium RIFOXYA2_FULL_47_19 TaxID=1797994 RepID=A0A1F5SK11_9BACT|nr:MAG: hypothetical protein A2227_04230 [Candidatus Falkowbacteria bacterium RIFOXYA2_FULL_47_19]OGF43121.1 MAG: hypothetical protein A2303_04315 [Candidatus Falkowbacteria bacterium RIFOXYB2_FULL_47_14]